MSKRIILTSLFLALTVIVSSTFLLKHKAQGGYIFLEVWLNSDGKVLEGEPMVLMIDFPTYSFSEEENLLSGLIDFEVNSSLLMILGVGKSLSGDAGGGAASTLHGVYSLPYEAGYGIVIKEVSKGGSIHLSVNGSDIILKPGQTWEKKREYNMEWQGGVLKIRDTLSIKNYGCVKLQSWG